MFAVALVSVVETNGRCSRSQQELGQSPWPHPGIPLNLLLDVLIVKAQIDRIQVRTLIER